MITTFISFSFIPDLIDEISQFIYILDSRSSLEILVEIDTYASGMFKVAYRFGFIRADFAT